MNVRRIVLNYEHSNILNPIARFIKKTVFSLVETMVKPIATATKNTNKSILKPRTGTSLVYSTYLDAAIKLLGNFNAACVTGDWR